MPSVGSGTSRTNVVTLHGVTDTLEAHEAAGRIDVLTYTEDTAITYFVLASGGAEVVAGTETQPGDLV
jgi:hypothetical protein